MNHFRSSQFKVKHFAATHFVLPILIVTPPTPTPTVPVETRIMSGGGSLFYQEPIQDKRIVNKIKKHNNELLMLSQMFIKYLT
jgi:hypothetical protein